VTTLVELLAAKTQEEREAQLLALLNSVGFPVSDYYIGSVARTIQKMVAAGLVDMDALLPQIAAGGFLGPFTSGGNTYPSRAWLELVAEQVFGITPAGATQTKQRCSLWCDLGAGPYTIGSVEQLVARSRFGRLYKNVTTGTVVAGTNPATKLTLDFLAESPGAIYNGDITGTIVELVTPLPGLNISNETQSFGGLDSSDRATRTGSSTGIVTPSGTPAAAKRYKLTVTVAGQVGAAIGVLDVDGVQTTISPLPASASAGNGVVLSFANGGQNPSFIRGDTYTFESLGSPIVNAGTDAESDDSLRARCRGRWPSLSAIPVEDRYIAWVRQASIDNGYGVTKITAVPSAVIPGYTDIRVATDAGAVPNGAVLALQAYIDARDGIVDLALVNSADPISVSAGGTAQVRAGQGPAVKTAAKVNWEAYLASLPIGGDLPGGVVRLAELQQAIMDAGAVDVSGLTLNAVAANLALAADEVAIAGNSLDTALTWLEVG
jgi:hypothetical protein